MTSDDHRADANTANQAKELAPLASLAEGSSVIARDDKGRFLTGNSGGGRPKGSKNRLTDLVLSVVVADFAENGAAAIAQLRKDDPATYLRLIGALVPRELIMKREQEPDVDYAELSYDQIGELCDAVKRRAFVKWALQRAED